MGQILFEPDGLFGEGSKEVLQGEGEFVELQADGLALGLGVAFGQGREDCVYGQEDLLVLQEERLCVQLY
jgi:hypothetical protein